MIAAFLIYLVTGLVLFSATTFALGKYSGGWGVVIALAIFSANVWAASTFWTTINERGNPDGSMQRHDGSEG